MVAACVGGNIVNNEGNDTDSNCVASPTKPPPRCRTSANGSSVDCKCYGRPKTARDLFVRSRSAEGVLGRVAAGFGQRRSPAKPPACATWRSPGGGSPYPNQ